MDHIPNWQIATARESGLGQRMQPRGKQEEKRLRDNKMRCFSVVVPEIAEWGVE